MVLEYIKCSASAMLMSWSCDECVHNICLIISAKMVIEIIKYTVR